MKYKPIGIAIVNPFQAQVAVFNSMKSLRKYHKKQLDLTLNISGAQAFACWNTHNATGEGWFAICVPDDCNLGTVVHECSHMVDFMCEAHDVPINAENTEIRAYMLGVLFMDVCEILGREI